MAAWLAQSIRAAFCPSRRNIRPEELQRSTSATPSRIRCPCQKTWSQNELQLTSAYAKSGIMVANDGSPRRDWNMGAAMVANLKENSLPALTEAYTETYILVYTSIWNPVYLDRVWQNGTYQYIPVHTSTYQYMTVHDRTRIPHCTKQYIPVIHIFKKKCSFLNHPERDKRGKSKFL